MQGFGFKCIIFRQNSKSLCSTHINSLLLGENIDNFWEGCRLVKQPFTRATILDTLFHIQRLSSSQT
eukprot:2256173-Rhodomonas_salina.1